MMAYWLGGVLALLLGCPLAYWFGKKDGAHEAMKRVYKAQEVRHKTEQTNIWHLLDDDLQKRIEAL